MLNLDTHILIHALNDELTPKERKLLATQKWGISAIVLWELAKLYQLKRINLSIQDAEFAHVLSRLHVWPLDLMVCQQMLELDFRSDPADEIIAATSIVYRVPLLTRDKRIRSSKMVPLV